jgi:outer membrane protein OmpA-like peptidoglycan-associated protein
MARILTLLCLLWVLFLINVNSQPTATFAKFKGTVYKIPGNEIKLGYGDHVLDNEIIGQIELASLNVPRSNVDTSLFPGLLQKSQFGIIFFSTLKVSENGCYKFSLVSDDGSKLWIENQLVISNDKPHKMTAKRDTLKLDKGLYDVKLWYYNAYPYEYGLILNCELMRDSIECKLEKSSEIKSVSRNVFNNLLFDFNSSELPKDGILELDKFCVQLNKSPFKKLTIIGYTDNVGTEEYNKALSLARAQSVMKYIKTRLEVSDVFLNVEGKGSSNPISSDSTLEGQKNNRRVEIYIE